MNKKILSLTLIITILLLPLTSFAHHGRGHHNRRVNTTKYYYCNGTQKHLHNNNTCPYYHHSNKTTVKSVQNKLNNLGYNCGRADGICGNNTSKALRAFQKANGLSVDGIIGNKTLKALDL